MKIDLNGNAEQGCYRWAIVGYGHVAVAHTEGIMHNRMRLVGFSTSNPTIRNGDATGLEFNIGPTQGREFTTNGMICVASAETLLSQAYSKADGVIICAPTSEHVRLAKEVAITGMDCFLEKPIAPTAAEARDLIEFWKDKRGKLVVGQVLPAFPEFGLLRRLLIFKGVNNVTRLSMERFVPWGDTDDEVGNRAKGGAAPDLGIYDVHLLRSVAKIGSVNVIDQIKRYGLPQRLKMEITMEGAMVPFTVHVGAQRGRKGFHHGYNVEFIDGTNVTFDGQDVRVVHGHAIDAPAKRSVGEIFGEELDIAVKHFRSTNDSVKSAAYLAPEMAADALDVLENAAAA